jgi:sodium/bile acid cotransporter 7
MTVIEVHLLLLFQVIAWILLRSLFHNEHRAMRVTGLFCCTQKTVALGIPLINAMFEDSPYLGIYSLPLLVWYVSQFLIGSFLAPKLRYFVECEVEDKYLIEPNLIHERPII